jgi:hypothetical protein
MSERPIIWSFGGGTQSVAIAVLVAQGRLPTPERIVMADTGREATETWDYLNAHVRPLGFNVEIVGQEYATVGLFAKGGNVLLPMYTPNGGRFPSYCSKEWKQRPIRRWLREQGYGPMNSITLWLGISVDEVHRAKPSGVGWINNDWPLLNLTLRRDECRSLVAEFGMPQPPRSSCWMCPHRGNEQWKRLRDDYPEDWERAIALERSVQQQKDPNVFLHTSRVALGETKLGDGQEELFPDCDGGYCFV